MPRLKIGPFPPLQMYGPEAIRLGEILAAARVEREEAEAEMRQLEIDAGRSAEALDRQLADNAYSRGDAMPGTPNKAAYDAQVIETGARVRAARTAEALADEALYRALVDNVDIAADVAETALSEAVEDHRKAIAAVEASRARMLAAEQARRVVDGINDAADYEAGNHERHEASRPEFVYPIRPARRPPQRVGNRLIHSGNSHVAEIDTGLAAMRSEIPLVFIRRDEGAAVANLDVPLSERRFTSDAPKPRRARVRATQ